MLNIIISKPNLNIWPLGLLFKYQREFPQVMGLFLDYKLLKDKSLSSVFLYYCQDQIQPIQ